VGTDLVTFSSNDVSVVTSNDLAKAFIKNSLDVIEDRNAKHQHEQDVRQRKAEINQQYFDKAREAYLKVWKKCEKSKAGHDFRNQDTKGNTHYQCRTCGMYKTVNLSEAMRDQAREFNMEMINILKRAMIEKDEETGILVWPT